MVSASGSTVFQDGVPETAFLTLTFEHGPTANVQLSWLAPHKVRQTIVVGSKRMVVYDDAAFDGAIRIYDRGLRLHRAGDLRRVPAHLPLGRHARAAPRRRRAARARARRTSRSAIETGSEPRSHARLGVEIVAILEAAHASLTSSGEPVVLRPGAATPSATPARVTSRWRSVRWRRPGAA